MKMFKLMGKRGFAVFTSLALCAGLVAPSFAATFTELQTAIDDETSITREDGTTAISYNEGTVTLNEEVKREAGEAGIKIEAGKNITLDLNGNDVDYGRGDVAGKTGAVHSVIEVAGSLTIKDTSDDASGEITGGWDSGVKIVDGGKVTLDSGAITNSATGGNGGGVCVVNGSFEMTGGEISGNEAKSAGGGVYVANGSFEMTGGTISNNTSKASGGGVGVRGENSQFTMNGGTISGNTVENSGGDSGGGGVWIKNQAQFTMNDGKITDNTVGAGSSGDGGNGGGVAIHQANFTMNGGEISNNESVRGTGVLINAGDDNGGDASFTMTGGYTAGQDGKSCIYLEEKNGKDAVFELSGDAVMDGSIHLGQGTQVITNKVRQPDGDHEYTGFDLINAETGEAVGSVAKDDTEAEKGYEAECDALLDINYSHEWDDSKWVSDSKNHGHPCKQCPAMTDTVPHTWDEGTVTRGPTCTAKGVKTYTCAVCGATKTESIAKLDHTWNNGEVTTAATCAAEGVKTFTCAACKATKTESVAKDPSNHVGETEVRGAKEATDEEDGYTGDTYCLSCDALLEQGTVIRLDRPAPGEEPSENPGEIIDDPIVPLDPFPIEEVEIDEPEVPLADLFTRADVIGYLWERAGSPDAELSTFEDVPEDHLWAVAIGWAQDVGIAVADEDGNFRPNDLVVYNVEDIERNPEGELEQFLNRYAVFAGVELEPDELFIELDGDPDDIVPYEDAKIIFDVFFVQLELALESEAV